MTDQEVIAAVQAIADKMPVQSAAPPMDPANLDLGELLDLLKNFDTKLIEDLLPLISIIVPQLAPFVPIILKLLSIFK